MAGTVGCEKLEALAPELALGTLSGPSERRRRASRRMRRVPATGSELAQIVDSMLLLATKHDPSEGTGVEDDGRSVCRGGHPPARSEWLFIGLDEPGEVRPAYTVELVLEAGGGAGRSARVRDGHGALAVTVDVAGHRARGVRLVDDEGESGNEAQFG